MPVTINGYALDASLTERHTFDSEVTEYPVEDGGDVTDNVRPKPIVVEIDGLISDTPIGNMVDVRAHETSSPAGDLEFLPSEDALARLIAIRDAREPVTIETSLKLFENMAMTSLEVPRDARTGHALRFTATFQQVILITNERTFVRVAVPQAAVKRDFGNAALLAKEPKELPKDKTGNTVQGVHWDASKRRFVDKDGVEIFHQNNTDPSKPYYWDPNQGTWVDLNTRQPFTKAQRPVP